MNYEIEVNWEDYLPEEKAKRFTFASTRNRKVKEWLKSCSGVAKAGPIKKELQLFRFAEREDYEDFLVFLDSFNS